MSTAQLPANSHPSANHQSPRQLHAPVSRFRKAERKQLKLRMAVDGPSGSGKTYSSLAFAFALGSKIAVIDTEYRSASKYVGMNGWEFDVLELTTFAPSEYTAAIDEAGRLGYDVVVVDSLSHAWEGKDGALEMKDRAGGNSFTAWKDITPMHRRMVESMLSSPCHVIATMRTKMEHVLEEEINSKGQKIMVPKKVGMAPIQRQGMEYEFDVVIDMDLNHIATVSKTRCSALDNAKVAKPGAAFMSVVIDWLNTGTAEAIAPPRLRITDDQLQRVATLVNAIGWKTGQIERALAKRGYEVSSLADLFQADADDFITHLEGQKRIVDQAIAAKRIKAEQAAATAEAQRVATAGNPNVAPPIVATTTPINGKPAMAPTVHPPAGTPTAPTSTPTPTVVDAAASINESIPVATGTTAPSVNQPTIPDTTSPEVAPPAATDLNHDFARADQIQQISLLVKGLQARPEYGGEKIPRDFYQRGLSGRGVTRVQELTVAKANDFIEKLASRLKLVEDEAVAAGKPSPTPNVAEGPKGN